MTTALITGASSGIGEAFARKLAAKKFNLVLVARSETKLRELCDELMFNHKITAHYVVLDLTEFEADTTLFSETERKGFEIDWLINNAGFGSFGEFADLDLENELRMIELNISSLVALTHRYLKPMRERRNGVIINVSSTASFQPVPYMTTYAATKAFVTSFSVGLWEETRHYGVRVMAICPGATETDFFRVAEMKPVKMRGMQTPDEVVEAALRGIEANRSHIVSGWSNYIGSIFGAIAEKSLPARLVGKVLRKRVEEAIEEKAK
jgi:uncharacterized protein